MKSMKDTKRLGKKMDRVFQPHKDMGCYIILSNFI